MKHSQRPKKVNHSQVPMNAKIKLKNWGRILSEKNAFHNKMGSISGLSPERILQQKVFFSSVHFWGWRTKKLIEKRRSDENIWVDLCQMTTWRICIESTLHSWCFPSPRNFLGTKILRLISKKLLRRACFFFQMFSIFQNCEKVPKVYSNVFRPFLFE